MNSQLSSQTEESSALFNHQASIDYTIQTRFETQSIPQLEWILEEGQQALKIDDLVNGKKNDARVIDLKKQSFFKIKAHHAYWTKIQLDSNIDTDSLGLIMELNGNGWPWEFTFKNVDAHIYKKGEKIRKGLSGTAIPYSKRDYPDKLNPSLIWLELKEKDSLDIWLRLEVAESTVSEIVFSLSHQYKVKQVRPANINNILFGAGIVLLILAFALFLWFREPIYLWFIIFQLFLLLHTLGMVFNNECYLFLFKENPRFFVIGSTIMSLVMIISLLQFGRVYIGTRKKFPKLDKALIALMILLTVVSLPGIIFRVIPSPLGAYWFSIRQIPMGLSFLVFLLTFLLLLFKKDKFARVFSFGFFLYIAFSLTRLILINISDHPAFSHIEEINHSFLIFTTTVILAYRFVLITQEKQVANKEKLNAELENLKQIQLTAQKTKEAERLEELEKIKSNFFSNITHEFRTPLTLIIEPLRQVIDQPEKPWLNKVKLAKNNSDKLLQLINQLLDVSKLENNQMQLELKRGNILEIVQPMFDSFSLLAKEKQIELSYNQPSSFRFFDFDRNKIEKIISNLISNAIKFTNNQETIQIKIKEQKLNGKPFFNFKIIDTGLGISTKDQAHIFDRFYQADGSNTRKHQGTGIGLSLSKELVELMDGTINLQSELNKGSIFEVSIPMHFEMEENASIKKNQTYQELTSNHDYVSTHDNKNIDLEANNIALVIEDNDELRQFIVSSIDENYQVIEASNGREGLEKAIEFIPNIIISDVMMPEMNGFEVCEKVKTNEKTAHIPLILLTAKTAMDSRIQGLEFGADAYMNKPFNTKELLLRMKNLIEVRVLLQQKFSQEIESSTKGNQLSDPIISTFDKQFLTRINEFILGEIGEDNLNIVDIAKEMGMSRTQLFRKIKALLNQSPSELLRNIRLKTAKQLLESKEGNISEIAYQVGFSSPRYFSTKFKEKYGVSPGDL